VGSNLLSVLIFLPLIGAALLYLLPLCRPSVDHHGAHSRSVTLVITGLTFLISLLVLYNFNTSVVGYQSVESRSWIPQFGMRYELGVDGISLLLVLLTTFLMPIVALASVSIHNRTRGYLANMLVLEAAMIGTFVSLDLFLFYVFWELMLAPMYFIIGIWGGKRRIYATLKFVLYTVFGSLLMLVAIMYTVWAHYGQTSVITFSIEALLRNTPLSLTEEMWLFAAFALAFCIKVPVFPFHTWLPDAHVEAPTGGSVVLAGVLLKMGLYGLIRFAFPLFPRAAEISSPLLATLAVIGIVYGALVAWAQTDMKKLVAYSSISHLGYCVLGLVAFNSMSISGSVFQMLNHGITAGALFLLVGVLYDRKHTHVIAEFGGLASKLPVFAFLFLVFTLSSIALPLTNGFVGEFMILAGSFASDVPMVRGLTLLAITGVILGAIYMLTLYMRTMYGEFNEAKNGDLTDLSSREVVLLVPLLVMVFWMGIFPQPFLKIIEPGVAGFMQSVETRKLDLYRINRVASGFEIQASKSVK